MSTVYDRGNANVTSTREELNNADSRANFYATITAKQPKSLDRGTSTSRYFFATISQ